MGFWNISGVNDIGNIRELLKGINKEDINRSPRK